MPQKQRIYVYFSEFDSEALQIVIFKNFIKSMTSWLSELKVTPSFYFAFKILDDVTATTKYCIAKLMVSIPLFWINAFIACMIHLNSSYHISSSCWKRGKPRMKRPKIKEVFMECFQHLFLLHANAVIKMIYEPNVQIHFCFFKTNVLFPCTAVIR